MSAIPISGQKRPFDGPQNPQPNKRSRQTYPGKPEYQKLLDRYIIARSLSVPNVKELIRYAKDTEHVHETIPLIS